MVSSRTTFLEFSSTVGVKLNPEATRDFLEGDFCSPHVHPAIIHAGQLIGCLMWQQFHHTDCLATVEALELDSAISLLKAHTRPIVVLQVLNSLSIYYFVRRRLVEAADRLAFATHIIRQNNIRFFNLSTDVPDPLLFSSDESEEFICALSYHMYKVMAQQLALGVPSELGIDYEEEFRSIPVRPSPVHATTLLPPADRPDDLPFTFPLLPLRPPRTWRFSLPARPATYRNPHTHHNHALGRDHHGGGTPALGVGRRVLGGGRGR